VSALDLAVLGYVVVIAIAAYIFIRVVLADEDLPGDRGNDDRGNDST
jgi:hypothetical protein